jgi:hypothetical protein
MPGIARENVLEVAAAEDQQPIETFAPHGPDPPLGVRPRPRRPHRRLDHTHPLRAEDLVKGTGELAVAVTDKKQRPDILVVEPASAGCAPAG